MEVLMRYLLWIIKLLLFAVVLSFAVKNTEPVTVRYYLESAWQAPLILVMLVAFCAGAAVGMMTALGQVFRQRRQIGGLRKELRSKQPERTEPALPVAKA
jgi:lipopolysaccharide assembly protein A